MDEAPHGTDRRNPEKSGEGIVLPFYFLCDVSQSMEIGGKLDAANRLMPAVVDLLSQSATLVDIVRVGIVDFAGEAMVPQVLCEPTEIARTEGRFTAMSARPTGTSFTAAFRRIRQVIEDDAHALHEQGYKVNRPAVFFLSDGEPTQDLEQQDAAFRDLTYYDPASKTGFRFYPVFVPFAVDSANERTMRSLIYPPHKSRMYKAAPGADSAQAIAGLIEVLSTTILTAGQDVTQGKTGIQLPPKDQTPPSLVATDVDDPLDFG